MSSQNKFQKPLSLKPFFNTDKGEIYLGDSAGLMESVINKKSVDLIITSPPFGLVRKKEYGNENSVDYIQWFKQFADVFCRILKPDGSLVIDIGGAWNPGLPTRSLYHFELLIMLCHDYGFHLAQEFYWWNPAKLPTPAEWVTVRRIRVKDAINCIWWLSLSPFPKASNRRVLQPYSKSMRDLLENGYKPQKRPSGHDISNKFNNDNIGAIPPNLIALANTESNSQYQRYCREHNLPEHPARFPAGIPAYFIRMLTNKGNLVLDPFAGSCKTGEVAEKMGRRWVCFEMVSEYVEGAKGRFLNVENETLPISRNLPYEIFAPQLDLVDEEKSPLPRDGGRKRINKKT
jgi:site-specific DNA-methyltransferase (cytosine-N4-specific)